MHSEQLNAAAIRKQGGYSQLVEALDHYTNSGWTAHVFPCVVGVWGLINPPQIYALLEFLEIHGKSMKVTAHQTILGTLGLGKSALLHAPGAVLWSIWQ